MNEPKIEVPRDKNINNKHITKDVEAFLLDIFSADAAEAYTYKELRAMANTKFRSTYGIDLKAHVSWAIDMLHYNSLIKRVAPGTFESVDGPDDVYTERETGHAPEGEFSNRGKNTSGVKRDIGTRKEFNAELSKSLWTVKMLKNLGRSKDEILDTLPPTEYNPVALKLAIKQIFDGVKADTDDSEMDKTAK